MVSQRATRSHAPWRYDGSEVDIPCESVAARRMDGASGPVIGPPLGRHAREAMGDPFLTSGSKISTKRLRPSGFGAGAIKGRLRAGRLPRVHRLSYSPQHRRQDRIHGQPVGWPRRARQSAVDSVGVGILILESAEGKRARSTDCITRRRRDAETWGSAGRRWLGSRQLGSLPRGSTMYTSDMKRCSSDM